MNLLSKLKLAAPLGLATGLFSAPQGGAQVGQQVPVASPVVQQVAMAPDPADGFAGYLELLRAKARAQGVSQRSIDVMTTGLTYNPKVVGYDRAQPGSQPGSPPAFWPYYRSHVDAARISGGRAVLDASAGIVPRIEAEYGVPGKMLMAIWGHESYYGRIKGDFDLARSLASLAYEGRRRSLFEGEFLALLKMADRGVPRAKMVGSWAGAFGNPQFLPSVYLRVARDGDGDGFADIWNNRADTLASIANYFRDAGWRRGEPWGVRASVSADFNRTGLTEKLQAPSCTNVHARHSLWKTVAEWKALGVQPQTPIADQTMATLFEPEGPGNGSFLLTGNYRVILQYNCSNYYALTVGLLADEISR